MAAVITAQDPRHGDVAFVIEEEDSWTVVYEDDHNCIIIKEDAEEDLTQPTPGLDVIPQLFNLTPEEEADLDAFINNMTAEERQALAAVIRPALNL